MKHYGKFHLLLPIGVLLLSFSSPVNAQGAPIPEQKKVNARFVALWSGENYYVQDISRLTVPNVQKLVSLGANINTRDKQGRTALSVASHWGLAAVVRLLLTDQANVNLSDTYGMTPLMEAAVMPYDDGDLVRLLLAQGPDEFGIKGTKYVQAASKMRSVRSSKDQIVQMLLAHGANAKARDKTESTALHWAVFFGGDFFSGSEWKEELELRKGINSDAQDDILRDQLMGEVSLTHIHNATLGSADHVYSDVAQRLLHAGADVNAKDQYGQTALMDAADALVPVPEVFTVLLAHGAKANAKDIQGKTALSRAKMADQKLQEAPADEKKTRARIITLLKAAGAK